MKGNYGKFPDKESFVEALKLFAKEVTEDGYGRPYSQFQEKYGVTRLAVDHAVIMNGIKKAPVKPGRYNPGQWNKAFNSYEEFLTALKSFSQEKDENGKSTPFSTFADRHGLNKSFVYRIATEKCDRRYNTYKGK